MNEISNFSKIVIERDLKLRRRLQVANESRSTKLQGHPLILICFTTHMCVVQDYSVKQGNSTI